MSSLGSLPISAAFARYLQNAGTSLATGFLVEFGDGTQTGLWLDSNGVGFKNNGYVTSFRCAAAAAQTLTFNYTASQGMVYPEMIRVLSTSGTINTTGPWSTTNYDANFKIDASALAVSSVYEFEMILLFGTAATTTSPQITVTGPAETTFVHYECTGPMTVLTAASTTGTRSTQQFTAFGTLFDNVQVMPSTTGYFPVKVKGIFKTSASAATSALSVSINSEVVGSSVTLLAGSIIKCRKLS